MARGRMLNKSISLDSEVADLVNDLGSDAGLAFTWAIAHLDRDGRITGDPRVFCAEVAPLIDGVTPDLVRSMLAKAHHLGLVEVYEADGKIVVSYPKFEKNQQGMRYDREGASRYPDNSGVTPDLVRQLPAEGKVKEGKLKEEKRTQHNSPAAPARGEVHKIFDHYRNAGHPRAHLKPKPTMKEWRVIEARLSEGYSVDDLCKAIDGMHKTPHNLGDNDRGQKYLGLELAMRNGGQVQRFMENDDNPPRSKNHDPKFQRSLNAGQQWLDEMEAKRG